MKKIEEKEQIEENIDSLESEKDTKESTTKINKNIEDENIDTKNKDTEPNNTNEDIEEKNLEVPTNKIVSVDNDTKKNCNKKLIIISIILCVLILLVFSTVFALFNFNNNTIISGVSIKGIDISGLTKEEAYEKVNIAVKDKLSTSFDLVHNDYKTTVIAEQFGATFDIESSINTAYE